MYSDEQCIRIAAEIVRRERLANQILEKQIPVRGITVKKLLQAAHNCSLVYCSRKKGKEAANFEKIIEDVTLPIFPSEAARSIAKHVLGHYFAWRRNKQMPEVAHITAKDLGYTFV